jgi:hypothetical protein
MTWQYMHLEIMAQQRYDALLAEAAQERLIASLRSDQKRDERSQPATKPASRRLRLPFFGTQPSELRTQILTSEI